MLVVADATPLHVLIRLRLVNLLSDLYGRVVVPPAVVAELTHANTPALIRDWMNQPPPWLSIQAPAHVDTAIVSGAGEREAICLALEIKADFLLVDDKEARTVARRLKLNVTGTLGVLELAGARGLIELKSTLRRLQAAEFFIDEQIIEQALERDARRRRGPGGDR